MSTKPRAIMAVTMAVKPENDEEFNRWYNEEHVPERLECPGFVVARRFKAVEGEFEHQEALNYLAIYELESLDALKGELYMTRAANHTEWTKRIGQLRLGGQRYVYEEIPITS